MRTCNKYSEYSYTGQSVSSVYIYEFKIFNTSKFFILFIEKNEKEIKTICKKYITLINLLGQISRNFYVILVQNKI